MQQSKSNYLLILLLTLLTLNSCGNNTSNQSASSEGFKVIENEIKNKFGNDAYYTDLTITYNQSIGNVVNLTVTENPGSLQMGQWNLMQNNWKQSQDISLEVPEGSKASDFMFQLNDNINLSKLGELAEKAIAQLSIRKNIENPTLSMAFVKFPKNGDASKTEYTIMLKPESGGSTFTFRYNISENLIAMDY